MPNGQIGKLAIVVKSTVPNSVNLGKILTPLRLATSSDLEQYKLRPVNDICWVVDQTLQFYNTQNQPTRKVPLVLDSFIRTLPDLDEDTEEYTTNERELETEK